MNLRSKQMVRLFAGIVKESGKKSMLFPNKIHQCILLVLAGMAASVLPLFIMGNDAPFYLSTIMLFMSSLYIV